MGIPKINIEKLERSYRAFIEDYRSYFFFENKDFIKKAKHYLHGLIQASAKNIERMIEVVPESNYDSQHHFISESAWDHRRVLDKIATDCDR